MDSFLRKYKIGEFSKVICFGKHPALLVRDEQNETWRISFCPFESSGVEGIEELEIKGRCFNFYFPTFEQVEDGLYAEISRGWVTSEVSGPPEKLITPETVYQIAYALKLVSELSIYVPNLEDSVSFYELPGNLVYVTEDADENLKCVKINKGYFVRINASITTERNNAYEMNFQSLLRFFEYHKVPSPVSLPQNLDDFLKLELIDIDYMEVMPCFEPLNEEMDCGEMFQRYTVFDKSLNVVEICNDWYVRYKEHYLSIITDVERIIPNFYLNVPMLETDTKLRPEQLFMKNMQVSWNSCLLLERFITEVYEKREPEEALKKVLRFNSVSKINPPCRNMGDLINVRSEVFLNYFICLEDQRKTYEKIWELSSSIIEEAIEGFGFGNDLTEHIYRITIIRTAIKLWSKIGADVLALEEYCKRIQRNLDTIQVFRYLLRFDILDSVVELLTTAEVEIKNCIFAQQAVLRVFGKVVMSFSKLLTSSLEKHFPYIANLDKKEGYAMLSEIERIFQSVEAFYRVGVSITGQEYPKVSHLYKLVDDLSEKVKGVRLNDDQIKSQIANFEERCDEVFKDAPEVSEEEKEEEEKEEEEKEEEEKEEEEESSSWASIIGAAGLMFLATMFAGAAMGSSSQQSGTALSANVTGTGLSVIPPPINISIPQGLSSFTAPASVTGTEAATTGAPIIPLEIDQLNTYYYNLEPCQPMSVINNGSIGVTTNPVTQQLTYQTGSITLPNETSTPPTSYSNYTTLPPLLGQSQCFLDTVPNVVVNGTSTPIVPVFAEPNVYEQAKDMLTNTSSICYEFTSIIPTNKSFVYVSDTALAYPLQNSLSIVLSDQLDNATQTLNAANTSGVVINPNADPEIINSSIEATLNGTQFNTSDSAVVLSTKPFSSGEFFLENLPTFAGISGILTSSLLFSSVLARSYQKLRKPVSEKPSEEPLPLSRRQAKKGAAKRAKEEKKAEKVKKYYEILRTFNELSPKKQRKYELILRANRDSILKLCFADPECYESREMRKLFQTNKRPSSDKSQIIRCLEIIRNNPSKYHQECANVLVCADDDAFDEAIKELLAIQTKNPENIPPPESLVEIPAPVEKRPTGLKESISEKIVNVAKNLNEFKKRFSKLNPFVTEVLYPEEEEVPGTSLFEAPKGRSKAPKKHISKKFKHSENTIFVVSSDLYSDYLDMFKGTNNYVIILHYPNLDSTLILADENVHFNVVSDNEDELYKCVKEKIANIKQSSPTKIKLIRKAVSMEFAKDWKLK